MGSDRPSQRRYTEDEIQEILRLTGQEQERSPGRKVRHEPAVRHEKGMTLPELQEAAMELGLDPARVALAARQLQLGQTKLPGSLLGAPLNWQVECQLPGRLTETDWQTIVHHIRQITRHPGTVERLGTTREWRSDGDTEGVRIAAHGEEIHVQLWQRNGALIAIAVYLGLCAGGLVGIATAEWLSLSAQAAWATVAGALGSSVIAARQMVRASFVRRKQRLEEVLGVIDALGDGADPEQQLDQRSGSESG